MPISSKDKRSNGSRWVSCPNCHDKLTETQKSRFNETKSDIQSKTIWKKHIFQKNLNKDNFVKSIKLTKIQFGHCSEELLYLQVLAHYFKLIIW